LRHLAGKRPGCDDRSAAFDFSAFGLNCFDLAAPNFEASHWRIHAKRGARGCGESHGDFFNIEPAIFLAKAGRGHLRREIGITAAGLIAAYVLDIGESPAFLQLDNFLMPLGALARSCEPQVSLLMNVNVV